MEEIKFHDSFHKFLDKKVRTQAVRGGRLQQPCAGRNTLPDQENFGPRPAGMRTK